LQKIRLSQSKVNTRSKMSYTQVICMKCAADYTQKTDPTGNIYQVNVYMCGVCGSREIYKKELGDSYVAELSKEDCNE